LVAKINSSVVLKGELPIEESFHWKVLSSLVNTTMTEYV
jgi:hypothetical protein